MKNMFVKLTEYELLKIIMMLYEFWNLTKCKIQNSNKTRDENKYSYKFFIIAVRRANLKIILVS